MQRALGSLTPRPQNQWPSGAVLRSSPPPERQRRASRTGSEQPAQARPHTAGGASAEASDSRPPQRPAGRATRSGARCTARCTAVARRARVPDESPAPDATLTARLRRHYSLPMAAAGAARRGAAASALSSLGSRCSGLGARYRRGPASRAQAPPRITWPRPLTRPRPLAACAADVRRVAMATADAHVRELPPCWGVRSLS